jgi:hypothetical protein
MRCCTRISSSLRSMREALLFRLPYRLEVSIEKLVAARKEDGDEARKQIIGILKEAETEREAR